MGELGSVKAESMMEEEFRRWELGGKGGGVGGVGVVRRCEIQSR